MLHVETVRVSECVTARRKRDDHDRAVSRGRTPTIMAITQLSANPEWQINLHLFWKLTQLTHPGSVGSWVTTTISTVMPRFSSGDHAVVGHVGGPIFSFPKTLNFN